MMMAVRYETTQVMHAMLMSYMVVNDEQIRKIGYAMNLHIDGRVAVGGLFNVDDDGEMVLDGGDD
jgi:hypothetical protein